MIVTHFETLEADFARYYNTDLSAVIWGEQPASSRRIASLINALPVESATARRLHPDSYWEPTQELLATIAELIDRTNRLLHMAWFKGDAPRPIDIPRPWADNVPKKASAVEMKAFFGAKGYG